LITTFYVSEWLCGYGYLCNFEKSVAISANDANSKAIFGVFPIYSQVSKSNVRLEII